MARGMFITFEGPEGSGKSTHAQRLETMLKERGYTVLRTREPGGTAIGEAIRNILQHGSAGDDIHPEAEILLFEASRAELVNSVIKPALAEGTIVICDRFSDSTTAYQGYGRGFGVEKMLDLNDFATGGLQPDLTILMDVEVEEGFSRIQERSREAGQELDRMEREARSFHEKVRAGYLELAERWKDRFVVVDVSGPQDEVAAVIEGHVNSALGKVSDER